MVNSNLSKDARIPQPESFRRDFKGIWIPKEIWLDNRLSDFEKSLLAEIDSLDCGEPDYCYASNKYFQDFFGKKERTVSQAITKLKNLGLIEQVLYDGRVRHLKSNLKTIYAKFYGSDPQKNATQTSRKMLLPFSGDKSREEIFEEKESNTKKEKRDNINNNIYSQNTASLSADASRLVDFFIEELKKRKQDIQEPPRQKWIVEMDRMLRIDKRDPEKIKAVISWLMNDPFWFGNILSIPKLRKQFDQLEIKMSSSKSPPIIKKYPIEEHKRKAQLLKNKWWKESSVKLEDDEIIFYAPGGCQSYRFGTQECEDLLNKTIKTKSL